MKDMNNSQNKILLSVCVAIYNVKEKFLRACIESLAFELPTEAELILGDDGSDKKTGDICREYVNETLRISYFRQENRGLSAIRNASFKRAKGRYIIFFDGDDIAPRGYSECVLNALRKRSEEYDILMYQMIKFIESVPQIKAEKTNIADIPAAAAKQFSRACITGAPPGIEDYGIVDSTPSSACNKVYRRQFLIDNNLSFKEGLTKAEDTVFNSQTFFFCRNLGYIPQILYFYRTNPNSLTHKYTPDELSAIYDCIECDRKIMKLYDDDADVLKMWQKYKLIAYAITEFELNIFHQNNPDPFRVRREQFEKFIRTEPFDTFFKTFDFSKYHWNERKLILKLAARDKFLLLDVMYKFPVSFKIYGKIKKIISKKG